MIVISRRQHPIGWLRVLAALLLLPFHTSRVFNFDEAFYSKCPQLWMAINTPSGSSTASTCRYSSCWRTSLARFNSEYTETFRYYITNLDFLHRNMRGRGDQYGGFGADRLWIILFLRMFSMVTL